MKALKNFVIAVVLVAITGCATGGPDNTVTGAVGGGLLGGGLSKAAGGSATKGALAGGLIGAGLGVFADHRDREDSIREQKVNQMIDSKTGAVSGAGNAQIIGAVSQTEANIAFAKGERDKCEATFATYKKAGIKRPYNCEAIFNEALNSAEMASAMASPELYSQTLYGRGGYQRTNIENANFFCRLRREAGNYDCRDLYRRR